MRDNYIWLNGDLVPRQTIAFADLTAPALPDEQCVFQDIACYQTRQGPALFRLEEHFADFLEMIRARGRSAWYRVEDFRNTIHGTVSYNNLQDGIVRLVFLLDSDVTGLTKGAPADLAIAAWKPASTHGSNHGKTWRFEGGQVIRHGLSESSTLFLVKNDVIFTPPSRFHGNRVLRSSVMTLANDLGYRVVQERISRKQLYASDEAFLSTTIGSLQSVLEVDERVIGSGSAGPVTQALQQSFYETTHGTGQRSYEWLDWVWGSFVGL